MSDSDKDGDKVAGTEEAKAKPKQWWQWLLIYPTLLVALLTAGPLWFEQINGLMGAEDAPITADPDAEGNSFSELVRFMKRNDSCVRTPIDSPVISPGKSEIWAVICSETGDIFVQITTPKGEIYYSGVFVDELDERKERGQGTFVTELEGQGGTKLAAVVPAAVEAQSGSAASPTSSAYVSPVETEAALPNSQAQTSQALDTKLAAATIVACQEFKPNGNIVRRLRQGKQCYTEIINGKTGRVEKKEPVSCKTPCS